MLVNFPLLLFSWLRYKLNDLISFRSHTSILSFDSCWIFLEQICVFVLAEIIPIIVGYQNNTLLSALASHSKALTANRSVRTTYQMLLVFAICRFFFLRRFLLSCGVKFFFPLSVKLSLRCTRYISQTITPLYLC